MPFSNSSQGIALNLRFLRWLHNKLLKRILEFLLRRTMQSMQMIEKSKFPRTKI